MSNVDFEKCASSWVKGFYNASDFLSESDYFMP